MSRPDEDRLRDILDAIAAARWYLEVAEDRAVDDLPEELIPHAILYNLAVIGEAGKHLSADVTREFPEIPWREISGLRDLIAHEYFRIDFSRIEAALDGDLADLDSVVRRTLSS